MPPFARREFSGNSVPTTITSTIAAGDLTINIALATGWPTGATGPFIVTIDQGLATEEKIEIASRTGLVLTATATGRGHDNTAAVGHGAGAKIEHTLAARDLSEANAHAADVTRDDHTQYLNPARHSAIVHDIDGSEINDGSVGYTELVPGQRWEPGDFKWSMQTADHTGWLKMDGRNAFARVGTYAPLFAVVGITLGAGVDGTTFGIGDVSKRVIMGKAASGVGSTLGGVGGSANAAQVAHGHTVNSHSHGGTSGNDSPDHAHNANHGHTADDNATGDHTHWTSQGESGGFAIRHGGASNGLASSPAEKATFSNMTGAGTHDHNITVNATNFNTAGATARHAHSIPAESPGTDSPGVSATDANLPPFLVMNGFIHT